MLAYNTNSADIAVEFILTAWIYDLSVVSVNKVITAGLTESDYALSTGGIYWPNKSYLEQIFIIGPT